MIPWAGDQIIQMVGVGLLQNLIGFNRTVEVFLIPPTGDVHDRNSDLLKLIDQSLLLPELIIIRMRYEIIPSRYLSMKIFAVCVRQRSEPQIPLIGIVPIKLEVGGQI